MCVYTHVLHNLETAGGQKKYKVLEQQWMRHAKEFFPRAAGSAAVVLTHSMQHLMKQTFILKMETVYSVETLTPLYRVRH
jgi:hypothetical protein